jgi:hypothetical protein
LQVVFFDLIKRAKDQLNHPWIAEATENSTYSLSFDVTIFFYTLKMLLPLLKAGLDLYLGEQYRI